STAGVSGNVDAVAPARLPADEQDGGLWPIARALQSSEPILVDPLSQGPGAAGAMPARALVLPLAQQGEGGAIGALVAGLSPRLMLDRAYTDFLATVASQIGTA